jgi:hypothetical protein
MGISASAAAADPTAPPPLTTTPLEASHAATLRGAIEGQAQAKRAATAAPQRQIPPALETRERRRLWSQLIAGMTAVGLGIVALVITLVAANLIALRDLFRAVRALTGQARTKRQHRAESLTMERPHADR